MDLLTHTATGLFLSRAGFDRFTPYATPILLLAANAPDVDVISAAGGQLAYLNYHRHLTHAIPMLPLMALLPVAAVRLLARRPIHWAGAYLISFIAVALHLALDSTNIYGIRLLLPFSPRWFHLDLTSVVDFWIWAAILLALAAPALSRLVGAEITSAPPKSVRTAAGRGFAIAALSFIALYNFGHAILHARAVAVLDSRIYGGAAPLRVAAFPNPLNPWHYQGLVETREFFNLYELNLLADFDPNAGRTFYKPDPQPALAAAARTTTFRDFLAFSLYPLWQVTPLPEPENAVQVEAIDLRFGNPQRPNFAAAAILAGPRLQVLRSRFSFGPLAVR